MVYGREDKKDTRGIIFVVGAVRFCEIREDKADEYSMIIGEDDTSKYIWNTK